MNLYGHEWYTGGGPQLCGGNLAISSSSGSGERHSHRGGSQRAACSHRSLRALSQLMLVLLLGIPTRRLYLEHPQEPAYLQASCLSGWWEGKSHTQDIWSKEECVTGELFGVNQPHDSFRNDVLSNRLCIPWHDLMTKLDQPIQRSEGVILLQFRWHFLNFTSL